MFGPKVDFLTAKNVGVGTCVMPLGTVPILLTAGNLPMSTGLPMHVNELKDIEPQLSSLVALYNIDAVSCLLASYAN